jgi:Family of unknown function (DUF5681)
MQFQPGQSGNPAGRPPGSRNKKTLALEAAFDDRAEEILDDVIARAKAGEKTAMRLCMERILAPRRERPVVIDLPLIETPADARKALAVVTAELGEGGITIGEAAKRIALVDRMVRLIERVAVLEQKQREEDAAVALGRKVREGIEAYMAQDEQSEAEADAEAIQTGAAADPSLYFPVNSENAGVTDGAAAASDRGRRAQGPSEGPPLARAA